MRKGLLPRANVGATKRMPGWRRRDAPLQSQSRSTSSSVGRWPSRRCTDASHDLAGGSTPQYVPTRTVSERKNDQRQHHAVQPRPLLLRPWASTELTKRFPGSPHIQRRIKSWRKTMRRRKTRLARDPTGDMRASCRITPSLSRRAAAAGAQQGRRGVAGAGRLDRPGQLALRAELPHRRSLPARRPAFR
jgi:hypothetical protein